MINKLRFLKKHFFLSTLVSFENRNKNEVYTYNKNENYITKTENMGVVSIIKCPKNGLKSWNFEKGEGVFVDSTFNNPDDISLPTNVLLYNHYGGSNVLYHNIENVVDIDVVSSNQYYTVTVSNLDEINIYRYFSSYFHQESINNINFESDLTITFKLEDLTQKQYKIKLIDIYPSIFLYLDINEKASYGNESYQEYYITREHGKTEYELFLKVPDNVVIKREDFTITNGYVEYTFNKKESKFIIKFDESYIDMEDASVGNNNFTFYYDVFIDDGIRKPYKNITTEKEFYIRFKDVDD